MAQIGAACAITGIATASAAGAEYRPVFRRFAAALVMVGIALMAAAFPFL